MSVCIWSNVQCPCTQCSYANIKWFSWTIMKWESVRNVVHAVCQYQCVDRSSVAKWDAFLFVATKQQYSLTSPQDGMRITLSHVIVVALKCRSHWNAAHCASLRLMKIQFYCFCFDLCVYALATVTTVYAVHVQWRTRVAFGLSCHKPVCCYLLFVMRDAIENSGRKLFIIWLVAAGAGGRIWNNILIEATLCDNMLCPSLSAIVVEWPVSSSAHEHSLMIEFCFHLQLCKSLRMGSVGMVDDDCNGKRSEFIFREIRSNCICIESRQSLAVLISLLIAIDNAVWISLF